MPKVRKHLLLHSTAVTSSLLVSSVVLLSACVDGAAGPSTTTSTPTPIPTPEPKPSPQPASTLAWVPGPAVPADAVLSGNVGGSAATQLHTCRANYQGGLHPGKLYSSLCNITYGGVELAQTSFEVLTGAAQWLSSSIDRKEAVVGGSEADGTKLVICRASYQGGLYPGKLVGAHCNIGYSGAEIGLDQFEVLFPKSFSPPAPVQVGTLETGLVYTDLGANHHMWTKAKLDRATGRLEVNTRYATFTWFGGFRGGAQIAFVDKDDYILAKSRAEIHGVDGTAVGRNDWTVPWSDDISPELAKSTHKIVVTHYWADNWNDNLDRWLVVGKKIGEAVAEVKNQFSGKAGSGS